MKITYTPRILLLVLTNLLAFSSVFKAQTGMHVHQGAEWANYGVINFTNNFSWTTERGATPGYFSGIGNAVFSGPTDASHVDGYVKHYVKAPNQGFIFPVGSDADLRLLTTSGTIPNDAVFATAWITGNPASTNDPTAPNAGLHDVSATGDGIDAVSTTGQWDWQDINNSGNGVTITVSIPNLTGFSPDGASLRLVGWNGVEWVNLSGNAGASSNQENSLLSGTMISGITALGIGKEGCVPAPPTVFLTSMLPQKNAVGVNYKKTVFEWDRADGPNHTVTYELLVHGDITINPTGLSSSRYVLSSDLSPSTTYLWKVRAKIDGKWTDWSEEIMFTTHAPYNLTPETTSFFIDHLDNTQAYRSPQGADTACYKTCTGLTPNPTLCTASPTTTGCAGVLPCNCMAGILTGLKWQCVEYVNRYYYNYFHLNILAGGLSGDAKDFPEDLAGVTRAENGSWNPGGTNRGYQFYPNGNANKPRPGDILVWTKTYGPAKIPDGNGGYLKDANGKFIYANRDLTYLEQSGHVSIVDSINNSQQKVYFVNGNFVPALFRNSVDISYTPGSWPAIAPVYSVSGLVTANLRYKCEGWLRALPALLYPPDNADNVPINPTFTFDETTGRDHKIFLYKRNQCGQYESVPANPIQVTRSNHYTIPAGSTLEMESEYMLRYETTVKGPGAKSSGIVSARAVFFKTGTSSQSAPSDPPGTPALVGCDTVVTPAIQFFTHKAGSNPILPVAHGRVYAHVQGQWEALGQTNAEGQLFLSGLSPGIAQGDSVYVLAEGFDTVSLVLTREMVRQKSVQIPMVYVGDPNKIYNISVVPWVNGVPVSGSFVTQQNIQIRVTAANHDFYHLIVPTELDDSLTVYSYPASQEFLSLTLPNEGINPILLVFTNDEDTVAYSTVINYYPANTQDQFTYSVLIQGDTAGAGASVYVNGTFLKTLTGLNEVIKVPDTRCLFSFTKPGYVNYFELTIQQDTIAVPWQLYLPDGPPPVQAAVKAFLQGPYVAAAQLMHDSLRIRNLIPLTEPYTGLTGFTHVGGGGGEQTTAPVLAVTGPNAIVDWVFLELRSAANPVQVLATRSALLQRDGDVVDVDGVSPVVFGIAAGESYFLVVRHRNHLGVQIGEGLFYPECVGLETDFRSTPPEGFYAFNGLNPAQKLISGTFALWAGNGRVDFQLKYNGSNNDRTSILSVVGLSTPNAVVSGYNLADYNLDGVVKYNGSSNDRNVLLGNVGIATPSAIVHDQVAR